MHSTSANTIQVDQFSVSGQSETLCFLLPKWPVLCGWDILYSTHSLTLLLLKANMPIVS